MPDSARSFRDFMEWALYDERSGYYGAGRVRFGSRGDFTTSSGVGPLFGLCVAAWIETERARMGAPDGFSVVELGPGDGRLAEDVLGSTDAPYVCVERSASLVALQRARLRAVRRTRSLGGARRARARSGAWSGARQRGV